MNEPKVLRALLERGAQFGAEYKSSLSNHLPMTLIALSELGASPGELESFYAMYVKRLKPKSPKTLEISASNFENHLGAHQHNAAYVDFFVDEHARFGTKALLRRHLPRLMPGVGGGAFHPLIRLAYALDSDCRSEIDEALAAWAIAYLPLGDRMGMESGEDSATQALLRIQEFHRSSRIGRPRLGNIFQRMERVASYPGFVHASGSLQIQEHTLEEIAHAALTLFDSTDDFTALHAVTATHALRLVLPHLEDQTSALQDFWRALSAAYLTIGAPALQKMPQREAPSWDVIAKAALSSPDEHVIKFVHTAREEHAIYRDERYRASAAKKAGLLR